MNNNMWSLCDDCATHYIQSKYQHCPHCYPESSGSDDDDGDHVGEDNDESSKEDVLEHVDDSDEEIESDDDQQTDSDEEGVVYVETDSDSDNWEAEEAPPRVAGGIIGNIGRRVRSAASSATSTISRAISSAGSRIRTPSPRFGHRRAQYHRQQEENEGIRRRWSPPRIRMPQFQSNLLRFFSRRDRAQDPADEVAPPQPAAPVAPAAAAPAAAAPAAAAPAAAAPAAAVDADVVDEPEVEAAVAVPGDDEPIEAPGAGDAAVGGGVDEGELMINYLALRYISLS